jgi:hypothetical protein
MFHKWYGKDEIHRRMLKRLAGIDDGLTKMAALYTFFSWKYAIVMRRRPLVCSI